MGDDSETGLNAIDAGVNDCTQMAQDSPVAGSCEHSNDV
jgi:hypothetical protein